MQLKLLAFRDDTHGASPVGHRALSREFGVDHYYLFDEALGSLVFRQPGRDDITFADIFTSESFQQALARLPVSRASVETSDWGMLLLVRAVQGLHDSPAFLPL